jgi:hypothetical protein
VLRDAIAPGWVPMQGFSRPSASRRPASSSVGAQSSTFNGSTYGPNRLTAAEIWPLTWIEDPGYAYDV